MITLLETTVIAAPIERCFDLALSIDLEQSVSRRIRAVGGRTAGIIQLGERVSWELREFGLRISHTSEIDAMTRPTYFRDSMVRGKFASYQHDHFFDRKDGDTVMRDVMKFAAPYGALGRLAEFAVLRAHLRYFLRKRNEVIKRVAESGEWNMFLPQRTE